MSLLEVILTSFSLGMDAFSVSICKGITIKKERIKKAIIIGLYFGLFQTLMSLFGYMFGNIFYKYIVYLDHWIAFFLLLIIGIDMIIESFKHNEINDSINFKKMIILSIATSIDALVVGITLSLFNLNIIFVTLTIGIITFILSFIGVIFGNKIRKKVSFNLELIGGIVLILIGIKILLEHLIL